MYGMADGKIVFDNFKTGQSKFFETQRYAVILF